MHFRRLGATMSFLLLIAHGILPGLSAAQPVDGYLVVLADCTAEWVCLDHQPTVVPGGNGVSGRRFVSDAGLRRRIWEMFEADVVDMETVAVARVAQEGPAPFLAFRSLSDLAAGGAGNEFQTFFQLAADNAATVVVAFLEAWAESKAARVPVEGQGAGLPKAIRLDQNYPNPFRDQTTLAFTLPTIGFIKLDVYDVWGRKRATPATGFFRAGRYRVTWDGAGAPDGVYFYRLQAAGTAITRRMVRSR